MDLKLGMSGPLVYAVQEQLNVRIPSDRVRPLVLNGKFDVATRDRVTMLQEDWGLTPTGVVDDITSTVLLRVFFEYEFMPRPVVIRQDVNRFHCWAASISSWSQSNARARTMSVWEAIEAMKKVPGALDPENEGINTKGWSALQRHFHMSFKTYGGDRGVARETLTIDSIYRLIKAKGPIVIAYNLDAAEGQEQFSHAVVAYGVTLGFGSSQPSERGLRIWVMDPWRVGQRAILLGSIQSSSAILVLSR